MKKEVVDDVIEAYRNDEDTLPKKTVEELLKAHLMNAGLTAKQAQEIIRDMNKNTKKEAKHNKKVKAAKEKKLAEVEHGTSCPRLVIRTDKKLIGEW